MSDTPQNGGGVPTPGPGARQLAEMFHERYERMAPYFGYETRSETRQFDPNSQQGRLMMAVCEEILRWLDVKDEDAQRWKYVRDHGLVWADKGFRSGNFECTPGRVGDGYATAFVDQYREQA
jgi:hypothetical protein